MFLLESMFSISFRTHRNEKRKQLVYFDHQNVNSLCLHHDYATGHASSLSPSSYRNMILNQLVRVFTYSCLLKNYSHFSDVLIFIIWLTTTTMDTLCNINKLSLFYYSSSKKVLFRYVKLYLHLTYAQKCKFVPRLGP